MQQEAEQFQPLTEKRIREILELLPRINRHTGPVTNDLQATQMSAPNPEKLVVDTVSSYKTQRFPDLTEDPAIFFRDYYRLMDIYCIIQVGGVQVQLETARAFASRERAEIEANFDQTKFSTRAANLESSRTVKEEIAELQSSISWRIAHLESIQPEEENAVQNCLQEINECLAKLAH